MENPVQLEPMNSDLAVVHVLGTLAPNGSRVLGTLAAS